MPQGTLAQPLFEWGKLGYSPLAWKQRVTMALDVARGVEYLHSLAQQSFIHRDLKPSNILLRDDMRAKVADFGLVKNAPDGKDSLELRGLLLNQSYLASPCQQRRRTTIELPNFSHSQTYQMRLSNLKVHNPNITIQPNSAKNKSIEHKMET
ncbi:hypothetical protein CsSME_00019131 [Camellia sinensis var. sinensis]